MKYVIIAFAIILAWIRNSHGAEILLSNDTELCSYIAQSYEKAFSSCRTIPSICALKALQSNPKILQMYQMSPALEERYGYSSGITMANLNGNNERFALLHLYWSEGARHSDTVQTWLVKSEDIKRLTENTHEPSKYRFIYDPDLQSVLFGGEKIADGYVHAWKRKGRDVFIENTYDRHIGNGKVNGKISIYRVIAYEITDFGVHTPLCHIEYMHNKSLKRDAAKRRAP